MEYKDYYKTLGVDKKVDQKAIKDAYRKLARKFHPDLNPGNKRAEEKFKEINEAYEVLGEESKRKKYDQLGSNWQQYENQPGGGGFQGFQGNPFNGAGQQGRGNFRNVQFDGDSLGGFSDFFKQFFGGGGGMTDEFEAPAEQAGGNADIEAEIELSLKDAYLGGDKTFEFRFEEGCGICGGRGIVQRNTVCSECRGTGRTAKTKRITVKIPAGVKDGSKIRITGQGGKRRNGSSGDLFLKVKIKTHNFFEVDGHNLVCEVPVALHELVLGANLDVPTFTGKVTIKVPPMTQNGSIFRLKEMGLSDGVNGKGDLMVKVKAIIPKTLSAKEKALFEELKKGSNDKPDRNIVL